MTKTHLLGVYRTELNNIQLAYASLFLWSFPDTAEIFEELYKITDKNIPKPFTGIVALVHDQIAMKIAREELYNSAYRTALKDLFPLIKRYCHDTNQLDKLKAQPWFQFWRILRNYFAHEMVFNFSKDEKPLLPISWSGITIDLSMNGKSLTHGQFTREKLYELLEVSKFFLIQDAA